MHETEHMRLCGSVVKQILQSYPNQTAQAPPSYVEALIRLLAEYQPEDVRALLHPKDGLAARCQYLPTVADAKDALESNAEARQTLAESHYRRVTTDRQIADQMAGRREREEREPPDPEMLAKAQELLRGLRATSMEHKLRLRRRSS